MHPYDPSMTDTNYNHSLLFMKEYVEKHKPTTVTKFTKIWQAIDKATKIVSNKYILQLAHANIYFIGLQN